MLRILESQAPAKQTATDTIATLCGRLTSATLLEDRRAAILGLRSFAKLYPASVASGGLRELIAGLRRDGEDPDTLKLVLETLLGLFEPDEKSPEASEDIILWLADEFTQRQDNVTALLDLLDTNEFYLRLYSLQILSHVCSARSQRTQEAILAAPLGLSRVTAVLDDRREAVRNEALLLLIALTPSSAELQKVVVFENIFDRIFALIDQEGGLTLGTSIVQDCLSLLSNLLRSNASNQAYFREIGSINQISRLLNDVIREEQSSEGVSHWARRQRDMNVWGLLAIIQLFLVPGAQATAQSQQTFSKAMVLQKTLQIAFHDAFGPNVRAKALETCADIIKGNHQLQEQFGDLTVPAVHQHKPHVNGHAVSRPGSTASGKSTPSAVETSNVIEQLLDLTLNSAATLYFEIRLAACHCVQAFLHDHTGIRLHVLKRAIDGHKSGEDTIPNILTVLLEPPNSRASTDPFQQWMAAVLLFHLIDGNADGKAAALKVSEIEQEHEPDEDYEEVTFIQGITSNVVAGVQHPEDEQSLLGYLMLLTVWLFDDPDAVNDLLREGSTIQGLISAVKVASSTMPLVAGLCCFLLGIVYEFSTKDSPIPRATLQSIILKSLSREVYIDRLRQTRESAEIRDFEILPAINEAGLPGVHFDQTFVDFFKDNYSRIIRAMDRDPSFEVSVIHNGVQKGVSRELVDALRSQVEEQKSVAGAAQAELIALRQKLEQEELEHKRTRETTAVEVSRVRQINESLQTGHEEELHKLREEVARQIASLTTNHEAAVAQLKREHLTAVKVATRNMKAEKDYMQTRQGGLERELSKARDAVARLQSENEKISKQAQRIQDEQQAEIQSLYKTVKGFEEQLGRARSEHESELRMLRDGSERIRVSLEDHYKDVESRLSQTQADLIEAQEEAISLEAQLSEEKQEVERLNTVNTSATGAVKAAASRIRDLQAELEKSQSEAENRLREIAGLKQKLKEATAAVKPASSVVISPEELQELRAAAAKQKDTQTELDDLLVVFADLEAKHEASKNRLKELGQEVSDDENEEEEEEEEEEEDEKDK